MSIPAFSLHRPRTVAEAVKLLSTLDGRCSLMAGGTDLLPGYTQNLHPASHVISLSGIPSMTRLAGSFIGAGVTLSELKRSERILPPVISLTAANIAGPAVRSSATLGGNLLLSSRCKFFNRSAFSRLAQGPCMKADGTACLAVAQDQSCYAVSSGDLVPVMLVLDASFQLTGPDGERLVKATDFYLPDGIDSNVLGPSEILTAVILPEDAVRWTATHSKLSPRSGMDFSESSVAVAVKRSSEDNNGNQIICCRISFGALGPGPILATISGRELMGLSSDEVTELAWDKLSPGIVAVRNSLFRPGYRKTVARKQLKKLLAELLMRTSAPASDKTK
jgi:4-hydroxybenzoyl-CoA reductase subunit beta